MRFVLDNDVSAEVCGVLRSNRHDCWTVAAAHLAAADDDNVGVYADDNDACLVTHDAALVSRRKKNLYGQVVHLDCRHPHAAEIVRRLLPDIIHRLGQPGVAIVRVTRETVRIEAPTWLVEA